MKKFYKSSLLIAVSLCLLVLTTRAQCTFTSTVPYYEGFSGITTASPLPQCWARSSTVTCGTFTSTGQAGFYYSPGGTSYFWSNGVLLNAGVVYSMSIMYSTTNTNYLNWTGLSLSLGTSQSSTGLVQVAASSTPVLSTGFAALSNTFTVGSSGIYYVAVKGSSSGACCGYYLYLDDLSITLPCSLNPVNLAVSPSNTALCLGDTVTMSASGADTYSWTNGFTSSSFTAVPTGNTTYYVIGTNTLTGCTNTVSYNLIVNPKPIISIFTSSTTICSGANLTLNAFGASSYIWSTGSNSTNIQVSPPTTTVYVLNGLNTFGCGATSSIQIVVNPTPTITASSSKNPLCAGEQVTLTATGAPTLNWSSPVGAASGSAIPVTPSGNITYTIVGISVDGCSKSALLPLSVSPCQGLNDNSASTGVTMFPNPFNDRFTVKSHSGFIRQIDVYEPTGKLVKSMKVEAGLAVVELENMTAGIYQVCVVTNDGATSTRLLKQ